MLVGMKVKTRAPDVSPHNSDMDLEHPDSPIRVPNAETLAAIKEVDFGKGRRAATVDEMMAKLKFDD